MIIFSYTAIIFYGFCVLFAENYEQAGQIVAIFSFLFALLLMFYCVTEVVKGVVTGRVMAIAGFSIFSFADIGKYFAFEHVSRNIPIASATEVAFLMSLGFFLFLICCRPIKTTPGTQLSFDIQEHHFSQLRITLVIVLSILLAVIIFTNTQFYRHSYFAILNYFSKAVIIYMVYLWSLSNKKKYAVIAALLSLFVMVDTSRRAYLAVLVPVSVIIMEGVLKKTGLLKRAVIVLGALVLIYVFLNFMRAEHDFGQGYKPGEPVANTINYMMSLRSIDTFYNTCFIYEEFPETFDYFYGETYVSVLVGLIPRTVWPNKPVGLGAPLGLMQRRGMRDFNLDQWYEINQYSLSPGFFGEAIANFGVVGSFLLSILFGFGTHYYDNYFKRLHQQRIYNIHKISMLPFFFLMIRGDFYSAVIYVLFVTLFVFMIDRFVILEKPKKPPIKSTV